MHYYRSSVGPLRCACAIDRDHDEVPTTEEEWAAAAKVPPHTWLGPDRPCFCLIGDDHVAEPRFEKES